MNVVESRNTVIVSYFVLGIAAFTALFPLSLMLLNSVKSLPEIIANPLALPRDTEWNNYANAWKYSRFSHTFLNSAILMFTTIALVTVTGSMSAYVLARKKIKYWAVVTAYLLATTTAPIQLFLFPLYFGFAYLGLINNILPFHLSIARFIAHFQLCS